MLWPPPSHKPPRALTPQGSERTSSCASPDATRNSLTEYPLSAFKIGEGVPPEGAQQEFDSKKSEILREL